MTSAPPVQNKPTNLVQTLTANEWGQITGLEANATYFVIRRPTADFTKERSREFVGEVRSYLHEQRVVTEKQVQAFQEKYGEPAKAKAKEIRETLEKRFDEIAKEVEGRVSELETKLNEKAPQIASRLPKRKTDAAAPEGAQSGPGMETPGEMPTGEGHENAGSNDAKPRASAKKSAKKSE